MVKFSIPWQIYAGIGTVLVFFLWGGLQYQRGEAAVQELWDADKKRAAIEAAQLAQVRENVTANVEIRYKDRIVTVRERSDVIVREVPVYIPSDSCELPGGFRLLHDAAASNTIPDSTRIPYAATVPAQEVAATVAENYGTCHEVRVTLEALQDWVRRQHETSLAVCRRQPDLCNAGKVE